MSEVKPIIITLTLDRASHEWLTALRDAHFPPERNYLEAHLTLFHALPAERRSEIMKHLVQEAAGFEPFNVVFDRLVSLGRGVAIAVAGDNLAPLHQRLQQAFHPWLTRQDAQTLRPHVTLQNKVTARQARALLDRLGASWKPRRGLAVGLSVWHYDGGPWEPIAAVPFV